MRTVRPMPYVLVGGLCGLAWAAGFRGWMAQLVGPESSYSWLTVVLVLLPGTAIGLLLGWAAYLRRVERQGSRWLVWSPVLFASALLDPEIARALVTNGQGSGALIVVATALAGGFALSRTGWSVAQLRPRRLGRPVWRVVHAPVLFGIRAAVPGGARPSGRPLVRCARRAVRDRLGLRAARVHG